MSGMLKGGWVPAPHGVPGWSIPGVTSQRGGHCMGGLGGSSVAIRDVVLGPAPLSPAQLSADSTGTGDGASASTHTHTLLCSHL